MNGTTQSSRTRTGAQALTRRWTASWPTIATWPTKKRSGPPS
ncbi:hypothetical protein AB0M44_32080 [Streptosporangium subroseum]